MALIEVTQCLLSNTLSVWLNISLAKAEREKAQRKHGCQLYHSKGSRLANKAHTACPGQRTKLILARMT